MLPPQSLKDTLQGMADRRRAVTELRVLAALSHPVRVQLLNFLLETGPRTATQCSAAVEASPSACSYHLRHLASFGLVERSDEPTGDKRERVWRCTATGYSYGGPPSADDAPTTTVRHALSNAAIDDNARIARQYVTAEPGLDARWRDAAVMANYGLLMTSSELAELQQSLDELIRPFIGATRTDAGDGAEHVHVSLQMFRRVEA